MFIVFGFEFILWVAVICGFLLMLFIFPLPTIIITGLCVWALVTIIRKGRE